jgi:hypothetical protein
MTREYVDRLVAAHRAITHVWLFGSRANGRERPGSDWDYLAFGSPHVLNDLARDEQFNVADIDLLYVGTPGVAMSPWSNSRWKKLRLDADLEWRQVSESMAEYREPASRELGSAPAMVTVVRKANALLVYSRGT